MAGISDFLRRIVATELRNESDSELLRRFFINREEAAFTVIVRRHGAMVYHVCRGVLGNEADAEDATQATFLVLAQKAAQVRKRNSLASWLHGVALRTARKLRASIARRRAGEAQRPPLPSSAPEDLSVREAGGLLHEELERLPARYRDPLVLCYLQGKTHDEAATELGWKLTVFRGRLERARKALGEQLRRRGLALSTALLTGMLAEARTALATTFAVATARAAVVEPLSSMACGLISPTICQLTQEVLRTMSLSPVKVAAALLAALFLTAGGYLVYRPAFAPPTTPPANQNAESAPHPRPGKLPGQILVCRNTRFAKLLPDRPDLAWIGGELDENDGEFIIQHRLSPDGKSVAFKHQTRVGEILSLWEFDKAWPGKVLRTRELVVDFFWMPDGKQLVLCKYQAIKDGLPTDFKFQTLDVATCKVADLKLPDGHWPSDVSRDGKWFLTVKNIDPKKAAVGAQLYRVERSTGEACKLFDGATIMTPPRWQISPDGKQIAGMRLNDSRRLQLFVGDVKAGTFRQATQEDRQVSNFFGWSPDGRKLLYYFTREPAKPKAGAAFHEFIAAIGADGRNRIELHDNERHYTAQGQRLITDSIGCADWR